MIGLTIISSRLHELDRATYHSHLGKRPKQSCCVEDVLGDYDYEITITLIREELANFVARIRGSSHVHISTACGELAHARGSRWISVLAAQPTWQPRILVVSRPVRVGPLLGWAASGPRALLRLKP